MLEFVEKDPSVEKKPQSAWIARRASRGSPPESARPFVVGEDGEYAAVAVLVLW